MFTSTVSHEMRTPIATIIFFLKLILDMFSADSFDVANIPEQVKYCRIVINQSELLSSYVEDLLDLR